MRYGILSDVHGNLEALETALAFLEQQKVERYAFLGDAVGYGPNPNEVCDLLRSVADIAVLGNHDAAVTSRMDTDGYHRAARDALEWCRGQLSEANTFWLAQLPYTAFEGHIGFSHAAPFAPEHFDYLFHTDQLADFDLERLRALPQLNVMGHSHLTVAFEFSDKGVRQMVAETIEGGPGRQIIATVGSVGQPRDRDPRLCCATYDTDSHILRYHRMDYDKETTRQKIVAAGLPALFGERLFLGV